VNSFGERFRAENRLTKPKEFRFVFSSRLRSSDKSLLFIAKDNGNKLARLGLTVPKKHISKSVDRNRLKRVVRESFRLRKNLLEGKDVVVLIKGSLDVNSELIEPRLATHWEKLYK
jgi:ribonuclease P protein component